MRNRGRNWEDRLLKHFSRDKGYHARILGGATSGMPDLVITHNKYGRILVVEAKATSQNRRIVPEMQILRCVDTIDMFSYYSVKQILFAFKFIRKGLKKKEDRTEGNEYEKREGKTYFIKFGTHEYLKLLMVKQISCNYDGKVVIKMKEKFADEKPPYAMKIDNFKNLV